jgi:hypothetical protein
MMQFTLKLEHYSCMLIHSRLGFPDIDDENLYYLLWTIMKWWTQVHGFKMKDPMRLEYDMASSVLTYTRLGNSLFIDSQRCISSSNWFHPCIVDLLLFCSMCVFHLRFGLGSFRRSKDLPYTDPRPSYHAGWVGAHVTRGPTICLGHLLS